MNRVTKIGVWVLVAVVLLLPFYELADYTEVWQHDGDLAAAGLFFLFSGMALLSGKVLPARFMMIVLALVDLLHLPMTRVIQTQIAESEVPHSPPRLFLSVVFCDLRI